jgi:hypothetical protein
MLCRLTANFHAAHSQLATAFADTARVSDVQYTDKNVPCHVTNNKVGDALCRLSAETRAVVLDFTVVHPRSGHVAGGVWDTKALTTAARKKCQKHAPAYDVMGFEFVPCVMTTYGQMHADLLALLHILARKRAAMVHVFHRPLCDVEALYGIFFAQSRARLGAAVARGMALRALGCSSLGASKVFLRHIAPARCREQGLTAGDRMVPGVAKWRLALAA